MIHPTLDLTHMSSYEVEIKFVENLSRNTVLGPRQSVTVITSEADELVIRYLSYIQRWADALKLWVHFNRKSWVLLKTLKKLGWPTAKNYDLPLSWEKLSFCLYLLDLIFHCLFYDLFHIFHCQFYDLFHILHCPFYDLFHIKLHEFVDYKIINITVALFH